MFVRLVQSRNEHIIKNLMGQSKCLSEREQTEEVLDVIRIRDGEYEISVKDKGWNNARRQVWEPLKRSQEYVLRVKKD